MKPRLFVLVTLCVVLSAAPALAQFGLYGAPEMLNLRPAAATVGGTALPVSYPAQSVAMNPPLASPGEPLPPELPAVPGDMAFGDQAAGGCGLAQDVGCYQQAACGEWAGGCGAPCCPWYGSIAALVMTRDLPNRLWTSYDSTDESVQLEHTAFDLQWRWGGEIRFGRRFCCDTWALEATYWTLDAFDGSRVTVNAGGVSTPLTVGHLDFDGNSATEWFDNALEHRLQRHDELHNVELSLIRQRLFGGYSRNFEMTALAGARFLRFEEGLVFSTTADPNEMTDPTQDQTAYLNDHVVNDLVGFQMGLDAYCLLLRDWRLFASPRLGIYNNHIRHTFNAYLGDGTVASQSEYPSLSYPVDSSTDVISCIAQVDLGLEWQFSQRFSARVGYRVLAATGIALADNQIPPYVVDLPELANIDTNGELVLHGAFVGLTYNY